MSGRDASQFCLLSSEPLFCQFFLEVGKASKVSTLVIKDKEEAFSMLNELPLAMVFIDERWMQRNNLTADELPSFHTDKVILIASEKKDFSAPYTSLMTLPLSPGDLQSLFEDKTQAS